MAFNTNDSLVILLSGFALMIISILHHVGWFWWFLLCLFFVLVVACVVDCPSSKNSNVIVIQVGLSSKARSIQRSINQIGITAKMHEHRNGYKYILEEITSSLLRHPTYCVSGYSSVELIDSSTEDVEARFNQLSREERERFDVENFYLVGVNNGKAERTYAPGEGNKAGREEEYIVLTILVAADEAHKLPVVTDRKSLVAALRYLCSIDNGEGGITDLHLLWSPQNENDALVEEELRVIYPLLMDLSVGKGAAA